MNRSFVTACASVLVVSLAFVKGYDHFGPRAHFTPAEAQAQKNYAEHHQQQSNDPTSANESFWPRERVPAGAVIEERIGSDVLEALRARGHAVTVSGDWTLGRLSAVAREGEQLRAAANPRGMQGYAVGR